MEEEAMAIEVSSEIGRRQPTTASKRRARRERNGGLAYGFDLKFPGAWSNIILAGPRDDYNLSLFGRLGLHCYNFDKGTNFKFVRWQKYSTMSTADDDYYITLKAMDPACNSVFTLQTLFCQSGCKLAGTRVIYTWRTFASRLKCSKAVDDYWDVHEAIDQFYTGAMPNWLSDEEEALACHNKKYYVVNAFCGSSLVQESDLHENDWLHLFAELALFSKSEQTLDASPPVVVNKVVVETREEYVTEAREILKAENAIFYISYKYIGVSSRGFAGEHKAIVRKTMDGKPEHMTLEVAFEDE